MTNKLAGGRGPLNHTSPPPKKKTKKTNFVGFKEWMAATDVVN